MAKPAESAVLTVEAIRKYAARPERRRIHDALTKSLFLIVEPSGTKSWQMRFREPGGRIGKLTLGRVDFSGKEPEGALHIGQSLSLVGARALAADIHRQRAMGKNVFQEHKAEKARQRAALAAQRAENAPADAFEVVAKRFLEEHARIKTRRWRETYRLLGYDPDSGEVIPNGLAQRWAGRSARAIDGHDVWVVAGKSRALFAALSSMFGWAKRQRLPNGDRFDKLVTVNPCESEERPEAPKARDRVLSDAELRKFWLACDTLGSPMGPLLQLLLLTGCRRDEVAEMPFEELSEDGTIWTIPGARTKNHQPHVVFLPPAARALLAKVPRVAGCPFVFTVTGTTPVSNFSRTKAQLDAMIQISDWRIHDLRRSAATGMAEIGIAPHIVEAALNHVSGSKAGVAGTYNRAAYADEKKAALERWASHIDAVVTGRESNVVPLVASKQLK